MSHVVQKGAVKFNSIMDMARSLAAKTNEPVSRAYIRIYKRMKAEKSASVAFHQKPRQYVRKVQEQVQSQAA